MPGSGWIRDPDQEFRPSLAATASEWVRGSVYAKGEDRRVLIFLWNRQVIQYAGTRMSRAVHRLKALVRTWDYPETAKGIRYAVYVFSGPTDNLDAARDAASTFAFHLKDLLPSFGISFDSAAP